MKLEDLKVGMRVVRRDGIVMIAATIIFLRDHGEVARNALATMQERQS